jgi:8-oxo-dGTP pyrophosphatase MutT (NUDIX family)
MFRAVFGHSRCYCHDSRNIQEIELSMTRHDHLRRLLLALSPADTREHAHRTRMLQLLDTTPQPFSRTQYEPGHVTASAFVLDPERSSLLLILHSKFQRWLQPGGHVEFEDRDVTDTVRREVLEETGVSELTLLGDGLIDLDVHTIPARGEQLTHEHFDVRFLFVARERAFEAGSDANAARWVPLTELLDPDRNKHDQHDESVLRAVRKIPGALQ